MYCSPRSHGLHEPMAEAPDSEKKRGDKVMGLFSYQIGVDQTWVAVNMFKIGYQSTVLTQGAPHGSLELTAGSQPAKLMDDFVLTLVFQWSFNQELNFRFFDKESALVRRHHIWLWAARPPDFFAACVALRFKERTKHTCHCKSDSSCNQVSAAKGCRVGGWLTGPKLDRGHQQIFEFESESQNFKSGS